MNYEPDSEVQPDLFPDRNIRMKAKRWMEENPNVYELFKRFTMELVGAGRKFNISLITERVRWECYFKYKEEFKINNSYRSYIARKLVSDIPELRGVFQFRKTRY